MLTNQQHCSLGWQFPADFAAKSLHKAHFDEIIQQTVGKQELFDSTPNWSLAAKTVLRKHVTVLVVVVVILTILPAWHTSQVAREVCM